jgi:type VI secretion system secreted protein VgrG
MTTQYQETDLAFLQRLLAEEGLFCWFEHTAEESDSLGSHRLVIADHNAVFKPNPQPRIRYTQAGATLAEDSLDRWHSQHRVDTAESNTGSWDYRSLATRPQAATSAITQEALPRTVAWHDPGQYAWQSSAHGERMLTSQRQAIDARLQQHHGAGTVRSAAPGSTFHLTDHPEHLLGQGEADHFLITGVTHHARNNLAETVPDAIEALGPPADSQAQGTDFYRNQITAIRANTPWRPAMTDAHGRHINPRPTARGSLTGIVVGSGSPTHTDRDGRIRVQFPWQRGAQAGSRNAHPSGSENAPASDALGVWLRVMAPVAGSNWGGHLTPRPGQEVIVAFQNGNIDRPVIVGTAYNGQGSSDAQSNQIGGGTMQASANAPAFFAGDQAAAHTHNASLSGIKSQQLGNSRDGQGGYNQLVFDDSPGESRIELATTQHQSQLQLGHLKQQTDNARLAHRGHGGELATRASAALRAGSGLLISADARANASSQQLDSREAITQTEAAQSLGQSLADLAQKQNASLKGDPEAASLPAIKSLALALDVMQATEQRGASQASDSDIKATQGGTGTVTAWNAPRLQYSAPGGIAQLTPKNHLLVAGKNASIISGQDTQFISQGNHSLAVKDGLSLFAHGKSKDPNKPNQETGIHLHAASGKVSTQAQSGKLTAAADKKVTLASTNASLTASAKGHLLATAQGAYLKIEGGNIQVHAPGKVEFKASQKNLTGPKSAAVELPSSPKAGELTFAESGAYSQRVNVAGFIGGDPESQSLYAKLPYEAYNEQGQLVAAGHLNDSGSTGSIPTPKAEKLKVVVTQGGWQFFQDVTHL